MLLEYISLYINNISTSLGYFFFASAYYHLPLQERNGRSFCLSSSLVGDDSSGLLSTYSTVIHRYLPAAGFTCKVMDDFNAARDNYLFRK